jgi:hypothetical protein
MKNFVGLFILLLLISTSIALISQDIQPVRLEVPSDINAESFHVEILGKKGVLIFYESNEATNENQRKWFFGLFDTSLHQQWLKFIPLADKLEFAESKQSDGKLFLLFRNASRGRSEDGAYEIVAFNLLSNAFTKVTGIFPSKAEIVGFEVIGNTGCIALNLKQDKSDLLLIDLTLGDITPIHILPEFSTFVIRLHADKVSGKFYVGLKVNRDNRYITDEILRFSSGGAQEQDYNIQIDQGIKSLNNYVIIPSKNNQLRIIGIYDIVTKRINSFRDLQGSEAAKSVGMFYLQFDKGQQSVLKFYDFMTLDNLYGSAETSTMNYNKINANGLNEGKKNSSSYYHLLGPQVLKTGNEYLFSVEVYQPYYTTETRMEYDFYGRPIPSTYQIFAGYDFYDVITVGLSSDGEMIWNNDFNINDLRSYKLERQSFVFVDNEFVSVAYVNNGKIILQTAEGPSDIGTDETKIDSKYGRDRVTEDNFNHIKFWYDKYFLVYGYQKLKNRTMEDGSTRSAFYVNKVAYN